MPRTTRRARELPPRHGTDGLPAHLCVRSVRPRAVDPSWWDAPAGPALVDARVLALIQAAARTLEDEQPQWREIADPAVPTRAARSAGQVLLVTVYDWCFDERPGHSRLVRRERAIPTRAASGVLGAGRLARVVEAFWSADAVDLGDAPELDVPRALEQRLVRDAAHDGCANDSCARPLGRGFQLEVDRVLPIELGGSDELGNLRLLCRNCRQRRGGRAWDAFIGDERRRAREAEAFLADAG